MEEDGDEEEADNADEKRGITYEVSWVEVLLQHNICIFMFGNKVMWVRF